MSNITVEELNAKKTFLVNSGFNEGKPILFLVSYSAPTSYQIHSKLFSTAERAVEYYKELCKWCSFVTAYPVVDIWDNPNQVDVM